MEDILKSLSSLESVKLDKLKDDSIKKKVSRKGERGGDREGKGGKLNRGKGREKSIIMK